MGSVRWTIISKGEVIVTLPEEISRIVMEKVDTTAVDITHRVRQLSALLTVHSECPCRRKLESGSTGQWISTDRGI